MTVLAADFWNDGALGTEMADHLDKYSIHVLSR